MSRHLHQSSFVGLLSDTCRAPANATRLDFAERLSLWLTPVDTIRLHGLLQNTPASRLASNLSTRQAVAKALSKSVQQARARLTQNITRLDETTAWLAEDASPSYAPYRKRHLDQQRQMELQISPLRAGVRQVLAKVSPSLGHLASLDALMELALTSREQKLLATAPLLLERKFEAMKTQAANQTHAWLKDFDREWQNHLLAELDLRLQPVLGLVEALGQASETEA